jgi:membrane AbrB-like protein
MTIFKAAVVLSMERLLITLLVGAAGGICGYILRMPAGAMIGAMLAVGLYNCLGFQSYMPRGFRTVAQILLGCMLGLSFTRQTFHDLKTLIGPVVVVVFSALLFCLILGFVLHKFFGLELATAFLGSSPGGMTELSALAIDMGADGPKVALLQLIRMLSTVIFLPTIIGFLVNFFKKP